MEHADVVVVGGGPAGSSCAARLVAAGLDVVVVDRARFPRDKPCAGWITPEAVQALGLDLEAYAVQHTLQPIRRFRVGWAFGAGSEVDYGEDVSYAIRRCELDNFLLRRSGARLRLGESVSSLRREPDRWIVNETVRAPLLVGAGGHFCPVARQLRGPREGGGLVIAQELEIALSPELAERCSVAPDRPELDFTRDLSGYGWCVRKGEFLNVGFGRREAPGLVGDVRRYREWLVVSGRIPEGLAPPLHGHAYRLREGPPPRLVGEGVLLAGDAAGLAFAASGEGIYPAIVSGQLAAEVLVEYRARGCDLGDYPARLADRLGRPAARAFLPSTLRAVAGRVLLGSAWFRRHVVLDRLFLHRQEAQR